MAYEIRMELEELETTSPETFTGVVVGYSVVDGQRVHGVLAMYLLDGWEILEAGTDPPVYEITCESPLRWGIGDGVEVSIEALIVAPDEASLCNGDIDDTVDMVVREVERRR